MEQELLKYKINLSIEIGLSENKEVEEKRFNERYDVLMSNINIISSLKNLAIAKNADIAIILNAFGYLNLLSLDLISAGYNLLYEKKRWQKVYFARQVALIIYEGMQDTPELLGKYFKALFADAPNSTSYVEELKKYLSELNKFKQSNQEYLKNIRINAAGHRDQDINKQLGVISEIDPYKIINLMFSFDGTIRNIISHLETIIVASVNGKNG